jgi:PAS domain S-box-containing protein
MVLKNPGVLMMDREGRIAFANNFVCDLLGTTPEELTGTSCFEHVFCEDFAKAKLLLGDERPRPGAFQLRLNHKDGTVIPVAIRRSLLQTPGGHVYGFVASIAVDGSARGGSKEVPRRSARRKRK